MLQACLVSSPRRPQFDADLSKGRGWATSAAVLAKVPLADIHSCMPEDNHVSSFIEVSPFAGLSGDRGLFDGLPGLI